MKKVLVTGAAGFIGQALCKNLNEHGIKVYAVAEQKDLEKIQAGPMLIPVSSDMDKEEEIEDILRKSGADTVYHLAWKWHGARSLDFRIQNENISLTMRLMEACAACGCKRVIATGSASEYAYSGKIIDGKGAMAPGDAYAAAKAASHILCRRYAAEHGIDLFWMLISSVYGPGRKDGNILSYTIRALLNGEKCSFTGLEQQWDYIYIDDLAEAMVQIGIVGKEGKDYPVGSGSARPLCDYIYDIRDLIAPDAVLGIGEKPYKNGKRPDNSVLDISELQQDIGFVPKTSFKEGIRKTIDDFRKERENV